MNSPSVIFSFLNYSNKIDNQEVEMWYRRHKLNSKPLKNVSIDVHHWIWLYWELFEQIKREKLKTIGHDGPVTSALVHIQLCLHIQQWTNSYWTITQGVRLPFMTKMPTNQKRLNWYSLILERGHHVSNISPPTRVSIRTFAAWALKHAGKIQS